MVQIQFFSGVHIKSKGGVLERLYCNHAVLPTKRAPKGEFARFSGMSIRHRRSFRGPNRPPVTYIVLKAGDNLEYASLRADLHTGSLVRRAELCLCVGTRNLAILIRRSARW